MSASVDGDRYILYLPPAVESLISIDNSLRKRIEGEIEKFLHIWDPSSLFDKEVSGDLKQIKKDRGIERAFAGWWDGGSIHVLCVAAIYKKNDENEYWNNARGFRSRIENWFDDLNELHVDGNLRDKLDELDQREKFIVSGPE